MFEQLSSNALPLATRLTMATIAALAATINTSEQ